LFATLSSQSQDSKRAAQLKATGAAAELRNHRVLTDLTGDFNRMVATNERFREKMKGYTNLWVTGHRELLQVVQ
jgi:hypothetical protein